MKEDISGQTINNRIVLKRIGNTATDYHSLYEVKCLTCEFIYNTTKSNLKRTINCKRCCPRTKNGKSHNRWEGGKYVPMDYYTSLKRNAKSRNIKFLLSLKYIDDLFGSQNKRCIYTGDSIDFSSHTASLDRRNNQKGYIKGNVQWVHKTVNKIKNDMSHFQFLQYCIQIHTHVNHGIKYKNSPIIPIAHHKNFKGTGYIKKDYFTSIIRNAKERKLEMSVSIKELNDLFVWQSGKCNLTGKDLYFSTRRQLGNASLDRIDNNKGYVLGNIQWVDKKINMIKYNLTQSTLLDICRKITKRFTPNVAISGYFQIVHAGHIDYIQDSRKHGGYLIAIINSDKQAKLKSTPSVVNENDRAYVINNIRGVDETVIAIDEDGSVAKTLNEIRPHVFCNGGDRNPSTYSSAETEICNKLGIKMVFLGGEKKNSSSTILKKASDLLKQ